MLLKLGHLPRVLQSVRLSKRLRLLLEYVFSLAHFDSACVCVMRAVVRVGSVCCCARCWCWMLVLDVGVGCWCARSCTCCRVHWHCCTCLIMLVCVYSLSPSSLCTCRDHCVLAVVCCPCSTAQAMRTARTRWSASQSSRALTRDAPWFSVSRCRRRRCRRQRPCPPLRRRHPLPPSATRPPPLRTVPHKPAATTRYSSVTATRACASANPRT